MKHTKGPWVVEPEEADETGCYQEACVRTEHDDAGMSRTIAVIRCGIEGMNANAYLIAAAPDLLEACKALEAADHQWANCPECTEASSFPELCEACFPLFDDARIKRRRAILKAESQ